MRTNGKRIVIGLTGGIGAGKSLALREFARRGAETFSLDGLAHELSRLGGHTHRRIAAAFGRGVLDACGEIDRKALASLVFRNPRQRRRLERITHPLILKEMRARLRRARGAVSVVDFPLLFETGLQSTFDVSLLVTAPKSRRISRVLRRGGLTRSQIERRMLAQMSDAAKSRLADVVVKNGGTKKDFLKAIGRYHRAFELMAVGK